jgi:hypothetical protein
MVRQDEALYKVKWYDRHHTPSDFSQFYQVLPLKPEDRGPVIQPHWRRALNKRLGWAIQDTISMIAFPFTQLNNVQTISASLLSPQLTGFCEFPILNQVQFALLLRIAGWCEIRSDGSLPRIIR